MAIAIINTSVQPITYGLCREFVEMRTWRGERRLSNDRMDKLKEVYDRGQFQAPRWAYAWYGGEKIRINGQHTSHMLLQLFDSGTIKDGDLMAYLDEYRAETLNDLADLFARFDQSFSVRTPQDLAGAVAASCPELVNHDIANSRLRRIASGMMFNTYGKTLRTSAKDQVSILAEDPDFVVAIANFVNKQAFQRTQIIAAMYGTWKSSQDGCREFWAEVVGETNPDPESPSRKLSAYIRSLMGTGKKREDDKREIYVKCIHAWNAYRDNSRTALRYYRAADTPDFH